MAGRDQLSLRYGVSAFIDYAGEMRVPAPDGVRLVSSFLVVGELLNLEIAKFKSKQVQWPNRRGTEDSRLAAKARRPESASGRGG